MNIYVYLCLVSVYLTLYIYIIFFFLLSDAAHRNMWGCLEVIFKYVRIVIKN